MTSSNKAILRSLSKIRILRYYLFLGGIGSNKIVKSGIYGKNLTISCPDCSKTAMATEGLWTRSLTSRQWVTSWWGTLPLPAFLFVFLLFSFIGVLGDQLSTFWWWKAPVQKTPLGEPIVCPRRRTPPTSQSLASFALNNLGFSTDTIDLSCLVGSSRPILHLPSEILRENYQDLPRQYSAFPLMCCADPFCVKLKKFRDPTI